MGDPDRAGRPRVSPGRRRPRLAASGRRRAPRDQPLTVSESVGNPTGSIDEQITFLPTRDLAATSAFYEQMLELPLALDQGACRIYRVTAEAYLGFCESAEASSRPGNAVTLTLVTQEVDQWHARLAGGGVEIEKPPQLNPRFAMYHCFLRDPNGHLIEIQRFEDPRWAPPAPG